MHRVSLSLPSLVAVAALLAVLMPAETSSDDARAAVVREATELLERYQRAIESGDGDAVIACLDPSDRFAWFTDGRKSYASGDDILRGLAGLKAARMRLTTEYSETGVLAMSDDVAYVRTRFATTGEVTGGEGFEYAGVITLLVERSEDGSWRIVSGHTSTPGGPPSRSDDDGG